MAFLLETLLRRGEREREEGEEEERESREGAVSWKIISRRQSTGDWLAPGLPLDAEDRRFNGSTRARKEETPGETIEMRDDERLVSAGKTHGTRNGGDKGSGGSGPK